MGWDGMKWNMIEYDNIRIGGRHGGAVASPAASQQEGRRLFS